MSFGWSAGGIVAAINLVNRIISSVSDAGGAREHFQELEFELGGLLRALNDIAELTSQPGQVPEVLALKYAACLCEDTLKRFYEKIKPFDANAWGIVADFEVESRASDGEMGVIGQERHTRVPKLPGCLRWFLELEIKHRSTVSFCASIFHLVLTRTSLSLVRARTYSCQV
jgi:hypothetical protein